MSGLMSEYVIDRFIRHLRDVRRIHAHAPLHLHRDTGERRILKQGRLRLGSRAPGPLQGVGDPQRANDDTLVSG